jgi:copper(I)-binding protein
MSGLQTPLSLAAQAAADAQAAAQAAAATQAAAQAAAATQAAASTISTAGFMKFLQAYKAPTKLATIDQPRAGGILELNPLVDTACEPSRLTPSRTTKPWHP